MSKEREMIDKYERYELGLYEYGTDECNSAYLPPTPKELVPLDGLNSTLLERIDGNKDIVIECQFSVGDCVYCDFLNNCSIPTPTADEVEKILDAVLKAVEVE
jgi:hypothetical protein